MTLGYVVKRIVLFVIIIWAAASLNFFLPRIGAGDPIRDKMAQAAASGGMRQEGLEVLVQKYQTQFGLDKPIMLQYLYFLRNTVTLDFSYSLANFPARVSDMIADALPWTLGLMVLSVLLGFVLGTLIGAFSAWPRAPKLARGSAIPLMTLSGVPAYLQGLILVYIFGLKLRWLPISGGYSAGMISSGGLEFYWDVIRHGMLPGVSIVLQALGFWALGMRGMMVTTAGEDYVSLAEANGLPQRTIFFRYGIRNAILPQFTALGLSLANVVAGQVIVEAIFAYPGIGTLLFRAIMASDYTVINGVVFILILSVGLATLLLDFLYPLLDPRISYHRRR